MKSSPPAHRYSHTRPGRTRHSQSGTLRRRRCQAAISRGVSDPGASRHARLRCRFITIPLIVIRSWECGTECTGRQAAQGTSGTKISSQFNQRGNLVVRSGGGGQGG